MMRKISSGPPWTSLCETVQHNCNISDARHASNYTLCTYLLKMREYFRWENGYRFNQALPQEVIGPWLTEREQLWEDIEEQPYMSLTINGQTFDPFDTDGINQSLLPQGYIYSGGIGLRTTPHFFMGQLLKEELHRDYLVLVADAECARDLTAPPAMSMGKTIFIRRESLKRMLWERLNEWRWHRAPGMMEKALSFYNFDNQLDESLEQMCDNEVNTLILHEMGEMQASEMLGDEWHEMLVGFTNPKAELVARAVKDHLADMLSTLPRLIADQSMPSLYLYFATQTPTRKQLFPSLQKTAQRWDENGDWAMLTAQTSKAMRYWLNTAQTILNIFRRKGAEAETEIADFAATKAL